MSGNQLHAGPAELGEESAEERLLDVIMLSLRTSDGLDLRQVAADFGDSHAAMLRTALQNKQASGFVLPGRADQHWRLSDPEGFLLSNSIMSDLFALVQSQDQTAGRHMAAAC